VRGFIDTRWGRLSYCSAGPGDLAGPGEPAGAAGLPAARPAIVLLHDPELSHTAFAPLVPLLSRQFQVVTLDGPTSVRCSAPGPDSRAARAFAQAIETLGLDRVVLYGVGAGGRVALQLTALGRPRVDGLVLSGIPAGLDETRPVLGPASCPVLLLSNPLDPLSGADRRLARAIPRARQVIVRTGRLPVYWSRPDVVAQEITALAAGGRELPILSPADFI
jgi:pimeloyl-ACP methyl ester carboxylesterase